MKDFDANRKKFLKKINELESELNLPEVDIRLHQLPKPGITIQGNTDPETVRKIMKIYNEVFNK